jgi:hypothetical protein
MSWIYICTLLGPGLHWSKSPACIQAAIDQAERDGKHAEADHLRIILERNKLVGFVTPEEKNPPG